MSTHPKQKSSLVPCPLFLLISLLLLPSTHSAESEPALRSLNPYLLENQDLLHPQLDSYFRNSILSCLEKGTKNQRWCSEVAKVGVGKEVP